VILAVVTTIACGKHCYQLTMCRLMPDTFLPASKPFSSAVSAFLTLCASTMPNEFWHPAHLLRGKLRLVRTAAFPVSRASLPFHRALDQVFASTAGNKSKPFPLLDNLRATCAIRRSFSGHIKSHKRYHINQVLVAWYSGPQNPDSTIR
jgi:hypothetical protein